MPRVRAAILSPHPQWRAQSSVVDGGRQTDRLGGCEVDNELELGGLADFVEGNKRGTRALTFWCRKVPVGKLMPVYEVREPTEGL